MNIVLTGFCGYVALAVIVFCIVYTMVKAGMDLYDAWVLRKWRKSKIDKACEWLEFNAHLYVDDIDQLHESALIGDFRKAMED